MSQNKKVLVVEDEKPLARALKLKLEFAGFDTQIAINGQECIDKVNNEKFDIILLDLKMPVMDGFQTLEILHKMKHQTTVFALSNLSLDDDAAKVLKLGANKYFVKSDTPLATIVEEVKKVI